MGNNSGRCQSNPGEERVTMPAISHPTNPASEGCRLIRQRCQLLLAQKLQLDPSFQR